jgi:hypothetical protein
VHVCGGSINISAPLPGAARPGRTYPRQFQQPSERLASDNGRTCVTPTFNMTDEKTVVIGIIHCLTNADFPPAELHAANFRQFAACIDAVVFGQVFLVAIPAG